MTPPRVVFFAPTLARAAAEASGVEGAAIASPRRPEALCVALDCAIPVCVRASARDRGFWKLARRRFLLPAAPDLLRQAISGITRHENSPPPGHHRGGPTRAQWIEGFLTDSRAGRLLDEAGGPRLWVVEDFRRLRLSDQRLDEVESSGIMLSAYRPLLRRAQPPR